MSVRASTIVPPSLRRVWDELDRKEHQNDTTMAAKQFTGKAIVSHGKLQDGGWKLEEVSTTPDIKDHELVVEIVASGESFPAHCVIDC